MKRKIIDNIVGACILTIRKGIFRQILKQTFIICILFLPFSADFLFAQDGNVGVGTDNPQAKLHVAGDVQVDEKVVVKDSTGQLVFSFDPNSREFIMFDTSGVESVKFFFDNDAGTSGRSAEPGQPFGGVTLDEDDDSDDDDNGGSSNFAGVAINNTDGDGDQTTTQLGERGLSVTQVTFLGDTTTTRFDEDGLVSKEGDRRVVANNDGLKVTKGNDSNEINSQGSHFINPVTGDEIFYDCAISKLTSTGFAGIAFDATNGNVIIEGDLQVLGSISKTGGSFKIDHPLDPENKWLYHSFVESPDRMNVYNGNVITNSDGEAIIDLPEYFAVLNKDFRYQLTPIGTFAQAIISEEIQNNQFKIKTDQPQVKVSWQVTGIRRDDYASDNPMQVEVKKTGFDKGKLIYNPNRQQPYSKDLQIHWEKRQTKRE